MKKTNNKKGFTLAELLVVVAIIAVLVAISIPIFTAQLEKSREATDATNIRSAYAELTSEVLTADGGAIAKKEEGNVTINAATANSETVTATVKLTQKTANWQDASINGSKIGSMDAGSPTAGGIATITITRATGAANLAYSNS